MGLPKGSLNKKERGNTQAVFIDAGYDITGYEPGSESDSLLEILNDPEIEAYLCRPQAAPIELARGMLDLAIVGEDWVKEDGVNGESGVVRKIGDLDYGKTRLVIGIPKDSEYENLSAVFRANRGREDPILCFTEYPNLTRDYIMQNEGYREIFGEKIPQVQIRGLTDGDNNQVQIINSDGVTEGYIEKGADFIVDTTQTGSALKKYGLKELETVMQSSAGLYAGPTCKDWKEEKAREIYEMLRGAIIGRKYFDVKFNVPMAQVKAIEEYLVEEGLCADEPTIIGGKDFAQVNILIPREKFPSVVNNLRKGYQASAIIRSEVKQLVE